MNISNAAAANTTFAGTIVANITELGTFIQAIAGLIAIVTGAIVIYRFVSEQITKWKNKNK